MEQQPSFHSRTFPQVGRRSFGRLARLCLKELREILRDRRTIATLVLMPLLVYPILSVIFNRFLLTSVSETMTYKWQIGVEEEWDAEQLQRFLLRGEGILREQADDGAENALSPLLNRLSELGWSQSTEPNFVLVVDLEKAVADSQIDLGVRVSPVSEDDGAPTAPIQFELIHQPGSTASAQALQFVEARLLAVNDQYLRQQLDRLPGGVHLPTQISTRGIAGKSSPAVTLGALVPLILILMTITGAVYPAIDLTAGERERGTLEALIATPVPRIGLLFAKYVAVLAVALLTASANLIAMTITLYSSGIATALFADAGISLATLLAVFGLLILFAAFFSAVLLAVTSFARSFKEAQAYLIPIMLLSLGPGIISLTPGLKTSGALAVTPLVNIVLLARDIFEQQVSPVWASATIISTALYAAAGVAVAARIFGTDAVLLGSRTTWSDLWRRPDQWHDHVSMSSAAVLLAVLFPCYVLLSSFLAQLSGVGLALRLLLAMAVTALLFGLLPYVIARISRVNIRAGFALRPAGPLAYLGAVILGFSLWPLAHELFLLNEALGLATLDSDQMEAVQRFVADWRSTSLALILLTMAVAPAVCEEFFFRGYLLTALRRVCSATAAIAASALLFGLFHVLATNILAIERFLPSTVMGLVLGWVCWRSGSVGPGMLLHACHNGLLVSFGYYQPELSAWGWFGAERAHLPAAWIGMAILCAAVGFCLFWLATRRKTPSLPRTVSTSE